MTIYRDLDRCTYGGYRGRKMRAIGWLGKGYAPTGTTPPEVARTLERLIAAWPRDAVFFIMMGPHTCELCGAVPNGGEVFIPGDRYVYVAPKMIVHYLDAHAYAPPAEFCDAVMRLASASAHEHIGALAAVNWRFRRFQPPGRLRRLLGWLTG